jgi:nucleoside-diphosphate-sugar epimerase
VNLISGASGFIGKRLLRALLLEKEPCRFLSRNSVPNGMGCIADLADEFALLSACEGVHTVFHCAGYAHAFSSLSGDDAAMHWRVNFEGTRNLIEAAGKAGVKTFVFLSSVKAMAEPGNVCAAEDFSGDPETAYGQSKLAAEKVVLATGKRYGMHVVNLRLAMVYGSGGRGNLERMGLLVKRGWFPPLPETGNRRSLVHVDDVVVAMRLVADDHRAFGKTYIIASKDAPSGRSLFNALRKAQGLPNCSWSVPASLLRFLAGLSDGVEALLKRRLPFDTEVLDRLLRSAWYSPGSIEGDLGWRANVSLNDGLREMMLK